MNARVTTLLLVLALAVAAGAQAPVAIKTQPLGGNPSNAPSVEFEAIFDQPVRLPDSGVNFIGEPSGTPFSVRSEFRGALEFTNTSHRAISSGPINLNGSFTVEFWFRSDVSGPIGVFSYAVPGSPNQLTYYSDGDVFSNDFNFGTGNVATPGRWHHVAIVRDFANSRLKIYFDGVETNDFLSTTPNVSNGIIVLGEDQDSFGGGFNPAQALIGAIDEVRIWNDVRTPTEIATQRFIQVSGTSGGLEHYWRFNFAPDLGTPIPGSVDVQDVSAAGATAFGLANGLALGNSRVPATRHLVTLDTSGITSNDFIRLFLNNGSSGGIENEAGQFLTTNPNRTPEAELLFRPGIQPRVLEEAPMAPTTESSVRRMLRFNDDVVGVTNTTLSIGGPAPGLPSTTASVKTVFENALPLNGVGGHLRNGAFPFPAGEMTVEFWFRTTNPGAAILSYATVAQPNACTIFANGTVRVDNTVVMPSCDLGQLDGEWHHMRITRSSSGVMFRYIDGAYAGDAANTNSMFVNSMGFLVIGNDQDSFGGGFQSSQALNGAIDELRIWTDFDATFYDSPEIRDLADPNDSDLLAYYRFEQLQSFGGGPVDDIEDLTGNGNHFDVQGGSTPNDMIDRGRNFVVDFNFSGPTRFLEYDPDFGGSIATVLGDVVLPTLSGEPAGKVVRVEDLTCEVTVNGGAPIFDEFDLSPGDQVAIHMDSPNGSHDFITTPLLLGQLLATGTTPVTTAGFPEVRLGFTLNPAPFVIFDGGVSSPFGGGVLSPAGVSIAAIAPAGSSGTSIVLQPIVQGASTANGIFAAGNIVVLNF
jgi:Concanavalin A-like lectin/glucanases superfamily/Pentaxin family